MRLRHSLLALSAGLVAVTGCDSLDPAADTASAVASSPRTLGAVAASVPAVDLGTADEIDLLVYFVHGTDPEEGADQTFGEQDVRRRAYVQEDVRRRAYVQETAPAVAITVQATDLNAILALLGASPLVLHVELDLAYQLPTLAPNPYVPLSGAYTGGLGDAAIAATTPDGSFTGQMLPWSVAAAGGDLSSARSGNGRGATDVDVYVIDSGVDHPDVNVVEALTFFEDGVTDAGSSLHGTHVAGIIAAVDDWDGAVGIAPGARVHSLDVFDGSDRASMSQIIRAVRHVTAAKLADPARAAVVNMSIGARTGTAEFNGLDRAIQDAIDQGVVFVVAAGNQGAPAAEVSPAHVPDAITVGAHDSDLRFALDFSNHGALVDLLAPGVRVVSTADGGRYAALDGTSMAAPHVAGAAALMVARRPHLKPSQVAHMLQQRALDAVGLTPPATTGRTVRADRF